MTNSFNVLNDFKGGTDSYVSTSPFWIVAIYRLRNPNTFNRKWKSGVGSIPDGVGIFSKPLILSDSCPQISISSTKSRPITSLQGLLYPTEDFLKKIFPGDYAFAWMMNNKETYDSVLERLNRNEACNFFTDGFKFFGKIESIRKQIVQNPEGHKMSRYSFNATGFSEFDNTLFYDPYLAEKTPELGTYFGKLGTELNSIIANNGLGISVTRAIPVLVDLLMGSGVPSNLARGNTDPALRSTAGLEGEYSYILPKSIGAVMGKTLSSKNGGVMAYADLLEMVYGIQKYSDSQIISIDLDEIGLAANGKKSQNLYREKHLGRPFTPDGTGDESSRRFTGIEMLGTFTPDNPQFFNTSIWNILRQYLNPVVNEMYVTLRVNNSGRVVPTLVLRQHPYTTNRYTGDLEVTKFDNLPRWIIPDVLIKSIDLGRSDALRVNFVHTYGSNQANGSRGMSEQIVQNPPVRDDIDIARSGFRPYMQSVPCSISDTRSSSNGRGQPAKWMEILSDFTMGQHLTLTGSINTVGIQSPICIGDNIEYDGALFHIESVTHTCSESSDGKKDFSTTLQLSHGVSASIPNNDFQIYANVEGTPSLTTNDPAVNTDGFSASEDTETYGTLIEPVQTDFSVDAEPPAEDKRLGNSRKFPEFK